MVNFRICHYKHPILSNSFVLISLRLGYDTKAKAIYTEVIDILEPVVSNNPKSPYLVLLNYAKEKLQSLNDT